MKTIEKFWLTIFFLVIVTLVSYPIITPNDVLIKEDTEYLYYKEYSWWGLDSCVYKYHKPIIYKGEVIDKYTRSHFAGVPGKGGHWVTNHHIVFKFDNRTEDEDHGSSFYDYFNKGDKVNIKETFYPRYNIEYWK